MLAIIDASIFLANGSKACGDKMSNRTVVLYTVIYCLLCCHLLRDHMLAAMHFGMEVAAGCRPAKLYCTGPEPVKFRGLGRWGEKLVKNR